MSDHSDVSSEVFWTYVIVAERPNQVHPTISKSIRVDASAVESYGTIPSTSQPRTLLVGGSTCRSSLRGEESPGSFADVVLLVNQKPNTVTITCCHDLVSKFVIL
jgi:hypothetical protein